MLGAPPDREMENRPSGRLYRSDRKIDAPAAVAVGGGGQGQHRERSLGHRGDRRVLMVPTWVGLLRRRRRNRGQSLVELALILPLLVVLAFGTVDLARGFSQKTDVTNAAEINVRLLSANSAATPTAIPSGCTTSSSPNPLPAGQKPVAFTVTCTFAPLTPLLKTIVGTPTVAYTAIARSVY